MAHSAGSMLDGKPSGYFQRTCKALLQHPAVLTQGGIAVPLLAHWVRYPDSAPAGVSLELAETITQFLRSEIRQPRKPAPETGRISKGESHALRTEALAIRLESILTRAAGQAARVRSRQTRHASVLLRYEAAGLRSSCRRP